MATADAESDFWLNLSMLSDSLQCFSSDSQQSSNNNLDKQRRAFVVINQIELNILQVLKAISANQVPVLMIPRRGSNRKSKRKLILDINKENSAVKFVQFIYILSQIYQLIKTEKVCTKRDLFYQNVNLFKKQSVVDEIIDDIACWFQVPRNWLNVIATSKGLITGDLKFYDSKGDFVNCSAITQGNLIHSHSEHFSNLQSNAKFVLIVEKEAIFHKLLETNLASKLNCILVTGKGFPDLNTRELIAKIWSDLNIPILVLVDCDPFGIEIMCVYRFGSMKMQHESHRLIPSNVVRWLGVFPEDINKLNLGTVSGCAASLSAIDKRNSEKMLERMNSMKNVYISRQIQILLRNGQKVEIEALDKLGINYLSNVYLPNKIRFGGWI